LIDVAASDGTWTPPVVDGADQAAGAKGTRVVTAFRARGGRERLRRDRKARRASRSGPGGDRAAHDIATQASDQDHRQDSVAVRGTRAHKLSVGEAVDLVLSELEQGEERATA
jgi:hypothetical protein